MRKIIVLATVLAMFACGGNKVVKQEDTTNDSIPTKIQLELKDGLGEVVENKYEGLLPAADCPGIVYKLTLWNQLHSGDGIYALSMTYLEAENGKDMTFDSEGKWYTQKGEKDETVFELMGKDSTDRPTYFLSQGDSLTMLNTEMKKIESILNYTIVKVKN